MSGAISSQSSKVRPVLTSSAPATVTTPTPETERINAPEPSELAPEDAASIPDNLKSQNVIEPVSLHDDSDSEITPKDKHNFAMGAAIGVGTFMASLVNPILGFVVRGVTLAIEGTSAVKELGWLKGHDGQSQGVIEHFKEQAEDIGQAVEEKTGSKILGTIAKYGSGIMMVPVAIATAVVGGIVDSVKTTVSFVSKAFNWLFGHHKDKEPEPDKQNS